MLSEVSESKKEIVKTPEYRRNMLQRRCVFLQLSTDTVENELKSLQSLFYSIKPTIYS